MRSRAARAMAASALPSMAPGSASGRRARPQPVHPGEHRLLNLRRALGVDRADGREALLHLRLRADDPAAGGDALGEPPVDPARPAPPAAAQTPRKQA